MEDANEAFTNNSALARALTIARRTGPSVREYVEWQIKMQSSSAKTYVVAVRGHMLGPLTTCTDSVHFESSLTAALACASARLWEKASNLGVHVVSTKAGVAEHADQAGLAIGYSYLKALLVNRTVHIVQPLQPSRYTFTMTPELMLLLAQAALYGTVEDIEEIVSDPAAALAKETANVGLPPSEQSIDTLHAPNDRELIMPLTTTIDFSNLVGTSPHPKRVAEAIDQAVAQSYVSEMKPLTIRLDTRLFDDPAFIGKLVALIQESHANKPHAGILLIPDPA